MLREWQQEFNPTKLQSLKPILKKLQPQAFVMLHTQLLDWPRELSPTRILLATSVEEAFSELSMNLALVGVKIRICVKRLTTSRRKSLPTTQPNSCPELEINIQNSVCSGLPDSLVSRVNQSPSSNIGSA